MEEKKQSDLAVLLGYAGSHKGLTFLLFTRWKKVSVGGFEIASNKHLTSWEQASSKFPINSFGRLLLNWFLADERRLYPTKHPNHDVKKAAGGFVGRKRSRCFFLVLP